MGMTARDWLRIIAEVIMFILNGMDKGEAVSKAACMFGVKEKEIWRHGGF